VVTLTCRITDLVYVECEEGGCLGHSAYTALGYSDGESLTTND